MKLMVGWFVIAVLIASHGFAQRSDPRPGRIDVEAEMEVHDTVTQFLGLLGGLRFDVLGELMTDDANIITARSTRSGFVNRVQSRNDWLVGLAEAPPRPFREVLTNFRVEIASGELALAIADFTIVRDTGIATQGVDFFTLIRQDGHWKLASIAFTSIPETQK
jgi:hypothetical protein